MNQTSSHIFNNMPDNLPEELFTTLFKKNNVHIERIVSKGHCTTIGEWYDQQQDEWVMVLQGQAVLTYQDNSQSLFMSTGDYVFIPAHTKHRVEWTDPNVNTVWLAIHIY